MKTNRLFPAVLSIALFFVSCDNTLTEDSKYSVKYYSNRGEAPSEITVNLDTILNAEQLPDLYYEGCTFMGWFDGDIQAKPNEYRVYKNVTLEASWVKNKKTANQDSTTDNTDSTETDAEGEKVTYYVQHYLQKVNGIGYVISEKDTETLSGEVEKLTAAKSKVYEGFTSKQISQQKIEADGSTTVKVYYDRNKITITFNSDGGSAVEPLEGLYGAVLYSPENPAKKGYSFVGWEPALPEKFSEEMTVKALWKGADVSGVSIDLLQSDVKLSVSKYIVTATEGFDNYQWYLNGEKQNAAGNTFYLPHKKDLYSLTVIAENSLNISYSDSLEISLKKDDLENDFVFVKGKTFDKESLSNSKIFTNENTIIIDDFYISACEITQSEYEAVMNNNPSNNINPELPVENVSWYEAIAYCNKRSINEGLTPCYSIKDKTDLGTIPATLDSNWNNVTCDFSVNGYRLPRETEWEYAARGGLLGIVNENNYCGSKDTPELAAWLKENSKDKTHEVSLKKSNELGIFDLTGNISEWCWDIYSKQFKVDNSEVEGINRIIRGGSYKDSATDNASKLYTHENMNKVPSMKFDTVGFRVVRTSIE